MLTVAGNETPEQARWLSEIARVIFMQGYWISRPLPGRFVRWLEETVNAAVVRCAYVPYYS